MLEAAGYRVHVHTSPHLVNWHERYRLAADGGGKFVDDALLAKTIARVAEANRGETITVFEILTAVTFLLFSEQPADAAIIEVGLGGRFDATNVITDPAVSLIMPVSLDHEAYLGDRVELIAAEKAGIIKSGCPVVIGAQETEAAQAVLVETAARLGCPIQVYGQDFLAYEENGRMVYQDEHGLMDLPSPILPGRHQYANAAAAIAAVRAAGFEIGHAAAERAMKKVYWPGRMQRLPKGRLTELAPQGAEIWLDGGHNPGAGLVVAEALVEQEEKQPRPLFLDLRHDQHQGPDRLFPRLRGHGPPCLHRAGQPVGFRRSERGACHPRPGGRPLGRAGRLGRQCADAAARHLGRQTKCRRAS